MSDSEDSTVTYTEVSNPFTDLSGIRSPGVDGPHVMPEDPYAYVVAAFQVPPSPDYVPGPEEPEQAPPSPIYVPYVPKPVYLEFMPQEDEVLPAEEQPLPAVALPTVDSPGYVPESDPEEDPEKDDEEDPEEDLADYPDDGDDEDESSNDDEDDDVDIEGNEEEEHPAPTDSIVVNLPAVDQAPSAEETEPFETDESAATPPPHPAYHVTARMSIRDEPPTPFWSEAEVARFLAIPSPTPLLLSPWSSPLPQIPSPPLPRLGIALGPRYDIGESLSAPTARPPGGFRADYGFVATMDREIMQDLERNVSYGITNTWDEMLVDMPGAPATDETELGQRMTNFITTVRHDTYEIYVMLDDEQTEMSREAWGRSMNASDLARSEVMSLRTTVLGQQAVITKLQAADRRRQAAITELLAADRRRQAQFIEALKLLKRLQTQMTEFQRQQGPAKGPTQPDAPEEAGSSS
ncbi:hypothetical protein Tco_1020629 [Tanacetum coccineum]